MLDRPGVSLRVWAAGALCATLFAALAWGLRAYTPDDAFISLSYAQRYAAGDGWVASAGTPPVEGFSNPLWVGLLVLAAHAQLDLVWTAKILGLTSGFCLVLSTAILAARLDGGGSAAAAAIAAFLLATWPPLALWSVSGMENALYGLLLTAGTLGLVQEGWGGRRTARSAWWWLAAVWTRPEAFGLAAVAGVWRLGALPTDRRLVLRWGAIVAGGTAVLVAWRVMTFGAWLPNTFYAKQNNLLLDNGGRYLWQSAWQAGFAVPAACAGLSLLARVRLGRTGLWHPVPLLASLVVAQMCFILWAGGDWMHQFRFVTPLAPFVAVLAAVGVAEVTRGRGRWNRAVAVALPLTVATAWVASLPGAWRDVRTRRSVDVMSPAWTPYRETVRAVARAIGPAATVVIPELGYPSYATDFRVLDPLGLASTHVAHLRYERADRLLRDVWRPDAIKLHSLVGQALHLDTNRWFRDGYLLLAGPADWETRPTAADGWYVRRDLIERPAAGLPPARAVFGGALELRAAHFDPPAVRAGDTVRLRLTWVPAGPLGDWAYRLFVRMPGGGFSSLDRAPLHDWRRTSHWPVGVGVMDQFDLAVTDALPPGRYRVGLTLYEEGSRPSYDAGTEVYIPAALPGASVEASTAPVSLGAFEVVTTLDPERLAALQAEAGGRATAGDLEGAWAVLAPARAAISRPPEVISRIEDVGGRLAARELTAAWDLIRRGQAAEAQEAVDRARALDLRAWGSMRDAFVGRLLEAAATTAGGETPEGRWRRIGLATLALHADPRSRRADRLVRGLWRRQVHEERSARLAAARLWLQSSAAQRTLSAERPSAEPPDREAPHLVADLDGKVVQFRPGLLFDQLATADFQWQLPNPSAVTVTTRYTLQLGYAGTHGYRVASVPVGLEQSPGETCRLTVSCVRQTDRLMLRVGVHEGPATALRFLSLKPGPWGAPRYPPQTPLLLDVALLALGPEGGALPLRVTAAAFDVRASAELAAGPHALPPARRPVGRPETGDAILGYRAYETLIPAD